MARVINLIIVILELIAYRKVRKNREFKGILIYYTHLSNMLTLGSSVLLVIFGPKPAVEVFRLLTVSMLAMTFFVTAFILVPMTHDIKGFLFSGNGLYHHTIVPILSVLSYLLFEPTPPMIWICLPAVVTLIYGLVMVYLNAQGKVDGPYPFFRVRHLGGPKTALWMVALMIAACVFSVAVNYR